MREPSFLVYLIESLICPWYILVGHPWSASICSAVTIAAWSYVLAASIIAFALDFVRIILTSIKLKLLLTIRRNTKSIATNGQYWLRWTDDYLSEGMIIMTESKDQCLISEGSKCAQRCPVVWGINDTDAKIIICNMYTSSQPGDTMNFRSITYDLLVGREIPSAGNVIS
jgi:hypothetical protein